MSVKPIFAWHAFWVGVYWDADKRRLYVLPIPCCGLVFDFGPGKDSVWQEAARTGGRLPAIKAHRAAYGSSLTDALVAVDAYMGRVEPQP
jgi:hypothetical protein